MTVQDPYRARYVAAARGAMPIRFAGDSIADCQSLRPP